MSIRDEGWSVLLDLQGLTGCSLDGKLETLKGLCERDVIDLEGVGVKPCYYIN